MYFSGIGDFLKDTDAIANATKDLTNPKLIIFITENVFLNEATQKLHSLYPNTPVIGGGGYSMKKGNYSKSLIQVLAFQDEVDVVTGIIKDTHICPICSVGSLIENVNRINAGIDNTICFEICTGNEEGIVTLMNSVLDQNHISMIGGTTFDWTFGPDSPPAVSYNGKIYYNSCIYALIKNKKGKIRVFYENFYQIPENTSFHYVNKASSEKRIIYELDGRPAADVYYAETGVEPNDLQYATMYHPLGRLIGNQIFVLAINKICEDGAISTYKRIGRSDCIYILEIGNIKSKVHETANLIKCTLKHISFIVTINCAHRQKIFEHYNLIDDYCETIDSIAPNVNFISGGEQGFGQHMNQSMVCMVFE